MKIPLPTLTQRLFLSVIFTTLFIAGYATNDGTKDISVSTDELTVQTLTGKVKGTLENKVCVWRGIPYAKAPVGELRFCAPQAAESWQGVKETIDFGYTAPQPKSSLNGKKAQKEDCLFLNIWSPKADGKKRPVMVWIHGGGFVVGSSSSDLYNGSKLAHNGDVVVVNFNYRLGILGFLYFEHGGKQFENNLGIQDQIAALKWVRDNIAAFGGDPEQVTIFGESAGGTSVQTLLACAAAKGLYKRAIAESGPASILWQPETAHMFTQKYLSILGINESQLQLLKTLPVDTLIKAQETLEKYMIAETEHKVFSPVIDGKLLAQNISQCLSPAQSGNVALMIGTNKDEATIFASKRLKMAPDNAKDLEQQFFHHLSPAEIERVTAVYKKYPKKRGVLNIETDAIFRIPAIRIAECQSMHSPVYMYRFEWSSSILNTLGLRSFHGLEIPFIFGSEESSLGKYLKVISTKKLRTRLTNQMQGAWINFARYGNPNGAVEGEWKPYTKETRATMIFDRHSRVVNDPESEKRQVWEGVNYY